ncbi:multicopper oxidase family protein [Nocardiopsis rhodophaea]
MRRRSLLLGGGGLAAGALLSGGWLLPDPVRARLRDAVLRGTEESVGEPLRDLPVIRSENGVLDYDLHVAPARFTVGGRRLHVDAYNGMLPGAMLRFRPGDTVRLGLHNGMLPMGVPLNAAPPMCATRPGENAGGPLECLPGAVGHVKEGETLPQMLLSTNLHTHGMQVSPEDPADNVFLRIEPGQSHNYEYQIPEDHPAGLHWYHPHFHGATSHQGWMGLSGPIVVEGDIDEVPEVKAARERVIVINEMWLNEDGEVPMAVVVPTAGKTPFSSIPAVPTRMLFPLNGQYQPDVSIRPGETQRWRVLNASPHRNMWLHVEEHPLYQIGQDGIPFGRTREVPSIMLSSANRAEFIVKGGSPGRYTIYAEAYDQGHPGGDRPRVDLGTLVVEGEPANGRIPVDLVEPPRMPDLPVANRRELTFSGDISGQDGMGVRFYIDDQLFDQDRIDQEVVAGTVEEWRLVNEDVFQHPIHIHVNPFQVIDVQGIPEGDTSWQTSPDIWWDTFRLPPEGEVTIRTFFRPDITGKTVFHCHILPHEDNGMMGTLLINPAEGAARR